MRLIKLILISVLIFGVCAGIYINLPTSVQHEVSDSFGRLTAPNLNISLKQLSAKRKSDIINEYRRLGFELKCFERLKPVDKLSKYNDSLCWALINSAFDDIPARQVAFFFYKEKLVQVRIEFPSSSFLKVKSHLHKSLDDSSRLDTLPGQDFGVDKSGNPLIVWKGKGGLIVTSGEEPQDRNLIILWTAKRIFFLERLGR